MLTSLPIFKIFVQRIEILNYVLVYNWTIIVSSKDILKDCTKTVNNKSEGIIINSKLSKHLNWIVCKCYFKIKNKVVK